MYESVVGSADVFTQGEDNANRPRLDKCMAHCQYFQVVCRPSPYQTGTCCCEYLLFLNLKASDFYTQSEELDLKDFDDYIVSCKGVNRSCVLPEYLYLKLEYVCVNAATRE